MFTRLFTCILFMIAMAGEVTAQPRPLGIVGPAGEGTIAYDINASGQVAAVLENPDGSQRGILFEKGKLIELGSLGGNYSNVRGINDKGQIIGSASGKDGRWSAFLFDKEHGMQVLGTLGGPSSHGMAINQRGEAVGFADTADDQWHAFLHDGSSKLIDLGTLGGKVSYAASINKHGQVVGTAALANGYRHAFLYDKAGGMVDIGTLGGRQSSASAINDSGVIVGASETANRRWHAFIWDGKRMVDLGARMKWGDSFATDINNAGHVVGTVQVEQVRMTFVWRDNKLTIHSGGFGLRLVNAINDREQIIGAEGNSKFIAATMKSNAVAVVTHGGVDLVSLIAAVIVLAVAGVLIRKRHLGLSLRTAAA
jgi:probable HAF family extracellular repeat protein